MADGTICVMGIFVADLAFRTPRLPVWGETVLGRHFQVGPGGKGSNQSVAVARAGGKAALITKIGKDTFGRMALDLFAAEGVETAFVLQTDQQATGGAAILIDDEKGENAIIVTPGASATMSLQDVTGAQDLIARSAVFMTQLELPVPIVEHGLAMARGHKVRTILNPAPALPLSDEMLALVDILTPNESEAEALSGVTIRSLDDARAAAEKLRARGPGTIVLTLGSQGVLVHGQGVHEVVPAFSAGPVVDTTGAGDAFNGGFAVALAEGRGLIEAAHFGCAVAGLAVTRHGTAPAMPHRAEVDALLARA